MTLQELLLSRHSWTDEDTIYLVQPWSCGAEAILSNESPDRANSVIRSRRQYDYFLEGFIVRDFLDDLGASAGVSEEVCERLIRYAIDDA